MKVKIDPFIVALLTTVAVATVVPCRGSFATVMSWVTDAAIALLFFLHGAKLSREAVLAGLGAWRIHTLVFISTFVMFPIMGLLLQVLGRGWLNPLISGGILYLCLLPSTVQSSIAFTSIAKGNVPAAVCSASSSNLLGIFVTPFLVSLLLGTKGVQLSFSSVQAIALQLLAPFILGHLSRPLTAKLLVRWSAVVNRVDRGSILLVVYTAFSAAVIQGLWQKFSPSDLALTVALNGVILAIALFTTTWSARRPAFFAPRRGGRRLLRLQEEPRLGRSDGWRSISAGHPWPHDPSLDAVPSDAAHGLRLSCSALRRPLRPGGGSAFGRRGSRGWAAGGLTRRRSGRRR